MPFTPTNPIEVTIVSTSTTQATTVRIIRFEIDIPAAGHPSLAVVYEKVNSSGGVVEQGLWTVVDKDGATPITDRWNSLADSTKSIYLNLKEKVYDLLQNVNDPSTGSPFLPAGTVS